MQDPPASGLPAGCTPMFCCLDHIDSWSTNEVAVNCHQEMTTCAAMASASLAAGPVNPL
jgi:endoglucanase